MIYGLQRKKKGMARMIIAEEGAKYPNQTKIQSLIRAKQNCQRQINEIRKRKGLNNSGS